MEKRRSGCNTAVIGNLFLTSIILDNISFSIYAGAANAHVTACDSSAMMCELAQGILQLNTSSHSHKISSSQKFSAEEAMNINIVNSHSKSLELNHR